MQAVPAFDRERIAAEFGVAGHAPDVRLNAVLFGEDFLGFEGFIQDWAAAEELGLGFAFLRGLELVNSAQNAFASALGRRFRHGRHRVVFVVHGDVVEDALAFLIHPADAVLEDNRQLIHISRVVAETAGHGAGEDVAVAVLMLKSLAEHGGAPGGAAHEEATAAGIGEGPDHVADALEAEHRVIHVEGDHGHAVVGVRGAGGGKGSHRSGFGDALFEDLPSFSSR